MFQLEIEILLRIGTVFISLLALIVSIAVAWGNRKTLHVEIRNDLFVFDSDSVFIFDENEENGVASYGKCLLTTIEVVNPSTKDIAFFDLRAFYPETNMNIQLLTRRTLMESYRDKAIWRTIQDPQGKEGLSELIVPETNYGIFKSNSFTRFHILMFPEEDAVNLILSFKVAIKARIKDQFAVTGRKKFKFYGTVFDITNWTEKITQQLPTEKEQQL